MPLNTALHSQSLWHQMTTQIGMYCMIYIYIFDILYYKFINININIYIYMYIFIYFMLCSSLGGCSMQIWWPTWHINIYTISLSIYIIYFVQTSMILCSVMALPGCANRRTGSVRSLPSCQCLMFPRFCPVLASAGWFQLSWHIM